MKKIYKVLEGRVVYKRILQELKKFIEIRPLLFLEDNFNRVQNNLDPETQLASYDLIGTNLILSFRYFFKNGKIREIILEENPYENLSSNNFNDHEKNLEIMISEICENLGIELVQMDLVAN